MTIAPDGRVVALTTADISIIDPGLTADQIIFTIVSSPGGQIERAGAPGVPITTFTQAEVNDRLITLLDRRNRTIDECSRYEAISLDQITGRLSEITSRQEAELDVLSNAEAATDYEDMARLELANEEYEVRRIGNSLSEF